MKRCFYMAQIKPPNSFLDGWSVVDGARIHYQAICLTTYAKGFSNSVFPKKECGPKVTSRIDCCRLNYIFSTTQYFLPVCNPLTRIRRVMTWTEKRASAYRRGFRKGFLHKTNSPDIWSIPIPNSTLEEKVWNRRTRLGVTTIRQTSFKNAKNANTRWLWRTSTVKGVGWCLPACCVWSFLC